MKRSGGVRAVTWRLPGGVTITESMVRIGDEDLMRVDLWPNLRGVPDCPAGTTDYMPVCGRCHDHQALYGLRAGAYCCTRCLRDDDRVYRLNSVFFAIAKR